MKHLTTCALFFCGVFACTPSIGTNPPPAPVVVARFDPSVNPPDVPAPTDLAKNPATGLLNVPISDTASAAEREFIQQFLNTLSGFPPDTPATANFNGSLDRSSINANSVRVIDLATNSAVPVARVYADVGTPPMGQLTIAPTTGTWAIGHKFAIALIGGANGLMGAQQQPVVGSSAWGLLLSANSLVTCTDLASPDCRAVTDVIPSTETDPLRRIQDQTAKALQLEPIRRGYKPIVDSLVAQGISRTDIVLLWVFSILSNPQATFDPANAAIPFPNDLATIPLPDGGVRVNLPIPDAGTLPDGGLPLPTQLFMGLNTLDGFSTSAPAVSCNSDTLPAITAGLLDPASVLDGGTGMLSLKNGGIQPQVVPCLNCASSLLPDGGTPTERQQLQLIPTVPLIGDGTKYIHYYTTAMKDTHGVPVMPTAAFALMRNSNPLLDASRNSTISTVPTALAQQLEPARQLMKPGIDALQAARGISRSQLALAGVFTTQSEVRALQQLRGVGVAASAIPVELSHISGSTTPFEGMIITPNLLTGPDGVFDPAHPRPEALFFSLKFPPSGTQPPNGWPVTIFAHGFTRGRSDYNLMTTVFNNAGYAVLAFDLVWHGERATCIGSVPFLNIGAGPCGVVSGTTDDIACADSVNQYCCEGQSCPLLATSKGRCVPHDLSTGRNLCDPAHIPAGMTGDAYCSQSSVHQGHCITDPDTMMRCEGGSFKADPSGVPCISGQNILNLTDLFATRDNFRQSVVDLTVAVRMIQATGSNSLSDRLAHATPVRKLDPTKINYLGQSLGSILGALGIEVTPEIKNVVLNVPGSDLPTILLTSPSFEPAKVQFLATLAAQNPPILVGTPAFDDFVGVAKWILDPGDSLNAAYGVLNGPGIPNTRRALFQYITLDQVIPNPTTLELINAANQTVPSASQVDVCQFHPAVCDLSMIPGMDPTHCPPDGMPCGAYPTCSIPPSATYLGLDAGRHGFLLNLSPPPFRNAASTLSQTNAAQYITNPAGFSCP